MDADNDEEDFQEVSDEESDEDEDYEGNRKRDEIAAILGIPEDGL